MKNATARLPFRFVIALALAFVAGSSSLSLSYTSQTGATSHFLVIGSSVDSVALAVTKAGAPIISELRHLRGVESALSTAQLEILARSTVITRIVPVESASGVKLAGNYWESIDATFTSDAIAGNYWESTEAPFNGDAIAGNYWESIDAPFTADAIA